MADASYPDHELMLSPDEMRAFGYRVVDMLVEHARAMSEQPVMRTGTRTDMDALLAGPLPEQGTDPLAVLESVQHHVLQFTADHTHPRFFGFVPSPSNFVSAMTDALMAGFNPFCGSWLVSAGPAEVEAVTVDWLRQICGMPAGAGGLFLSGGSLATLTALIVARETRLGRNAAGAVVYCSDQTHSSVQKALMLLGLPEDALCIIPSDSAFRLPLDAVRSAIAADRAAGRRPFCLVGNAGTTNTGAIDPLNALAELCAEEELWFHVDGAYGAPAALTETGRQLLDGMGRADSLAIDPHKWLFQPYETGCVLVRDHTLLPATFTVHPEYLRDVALRLDEINYRDYGIQLTRNFRALRLWMSLKVFGLEAFRAAVAWGIHLTDVAECALRELPDWQIVTPAQIGIITFRYAPSGVGEEQIDAVNQAIIDAGITAGFAFVTSTVLRGRTVLRLCTINPRTTEADIRATVAHLNALATRQPVAR